MLSVETNLYIVVRDSVDKRVVSHPYKQIGVTKPFNRFVHICNSSKGNLWKKNQRFNKILTLSSTKSDLKVIKGTFS